MSYIQLNYKTAEVRTEVVPERTKKDPIFRANTNFHTELAMDTPKNDYSYNKPDYSIYVFNTSDMEIAQLYPNGIVLPIRKKEHLSYTEELFNLNNKSLDKGVYIVEYYSINTTDEHYSPEFINNMFNYYTYNNPLWEKEKRHNLLKYIQEITESNTKTSMIKFTVRIVTFIKDTYVRDHGVVFLHASNILLCDASNIKQVSHPNTNLYKESLQKYNNDVLTELVTINSIDIEIVDHSYTNEYYIHVGNNIRKLNVNKDITKEQGCNITYYKNKQPIETESYSIEDMRSKLGLYKTHQEAYYYGLPQLKEKSIDLEHKKLEESKKYHSFVHKNSAVALAEYKKTTDIMLSDFKQREEYKLQKYQSAHIMLGLLQKMTESKISLEKAQLNLTASQLDLETLRMKGEHLEKELTNRERLEVTKGGMGVTEKLLQLMMLIGKLTATAA